MIMMISMTVEMINQVKYGLQRISPHQESGHEQVISEVPSRNSKNTTLSIGGQYNHIA